MDRIDGKSFDLTAENIEKLKALFPSVFTEGKIDIEKLLAILGENVETDKEKYAFSWKGKMDAIRMAQIRSSGTLRPAVDESVNFDTTQNLYIEGDNLEVLKLLAAAYNNSIKMIYIDPPYNTGNDFVYNDSFGDSIQAYKEITGQTQRSNPETSGRYHTNWLNMMYPRLKLAHVLLKEDGVIFISIDDNEVANLRKICDEIFGEDNFVALLPILSNPRGRQSSKFFAETHEYALCYAKNYNSLDINGQKLDDKQKQEYREKDVHGHYRLIGLRLRGGRATASESPTLHFPIYYNKELDDFHLERQCPEDFEIIPRFEDGTLGTWRWSKKKILEQKADLIVKPVKDRFDVFQKDYLTDDKEMKIKSLWHEKEINYDNSKRELKSLEFDDIFDYAKPLYLIKKIIACGSNDNDIILDFFSGSATTAHAVMQLNAEDGGSRKFICVQLPELTDEKSEAYKAGFKTICDIGKERIRRVGAKINESVKGATELDTGFKVFKLDSTNLVAWDNSYTEDEENLASRIIQQSLYYLKEGRSDLDLVTEIMLKNGRPLTDKITEAEIKGIKIYIIENPDYKILVCLQPHIDVEAVESMLTDLPPIGTFIFADRCFTDANAVLNTKEMLKRENRKMRMF